MPELLKKIKQYTKLVVQTYSHQNLFAFICRFPGPTNYFYNFNIKLNYCFIRKINITDNFIWKCFW